MNYHRIYHSIIKHRRLSPLSEGYGETHHIVPKSLGGSDSPDNLVRLSAREHFICHCLLARMYPINSSEWHKMNHALLIMKTQSSVQDRYFNSHLYEYFRKGFSLVMSQSQSGTKNSQYGTRWIYHPAQKKNRKISKIDPLPEGWLEGRKINWNEKTTQCRNCGTLFESRPNVSYCSQKCRDNAKSNSLTGREQEFINAYRDTGSINSALKQLGLPGAVGGHYYNAKKLLESLDSNAERQHNIN